MLDTLYDRRTLVSEMAQSYLHDMAREKTRLEARRFEQDRLHFSASTLRSLGDDQMADQLQLAARDLAREIRMAEQNVDRMGRILALMQARLDVGDVRPPEAVRRRRGGAGAHQTQNRVDLVNLTSLREPS